MLTYRMQNAPPLNHLRHELNRMFERFAGDDSTSGRRTYSRGHVFPAVNVWQDDDHIFVEAELPGLCSDELELTVLGNELIIKGIRSAIEPTEGVTLHWRERGSGPFNRVIPLPMDVSDSDVDATFHNGVLTVTLAKAEIARARRIPVNTLSSTKKQETMP